MKVLMLKLYSISLGIRLLDHDEYSRWMNSAKNTLESAVNDLNGKFFSWTCFKAQQAAEKALKALLWGSGKPKVGHSLANLLSEIEKELRVKVPDEIRENCIRLSKYYIITRYPNVWESGTPEEYFTHDEAREAVQRAEQVIKWVEAIWKKLSKNV